MFFCEAVVYSTVSFSFFQSIDYYEWRHKHSVNVGELSTDDISVSGNSLTIKVNVY